MLLEERKYVVRSAFGPAIVIEEVSPFRAVEEYSEAEELESGTTVYVDGVGDFNVVRSGDRYVSCMK